MQPRKALDWRRTSEEDRLRSRMKPSRELAMWVAALALLGGVASLRAQTASSPDAKAHTGKSDPTSRVTIEVSGGEKESPGENASVYLKYVEEHKLKKDRQGEVDVKNKREGTGQNPEAPTGRDFLQVGGGGWKTRRAWYRATGGQRT